MWKDVEVGLEKVAVEQRKEKPSLDNLGFGVHFTDHMFMMKWDRENGWHEAKICPCRDLQLHPAAMVFHYGQAVFEGLKAFRGKDSQLFLFRAEDSFERMNASALRMCMPRFPVDKVLKALKALVYLEREWVPVADGASLYIRPTMVAVEPALGVRPSDAYCFYIILSPVGAYYKEGFNPIKIYVSDEHVRAVKGGVGYAKTSGNYAASLYTSELAKKSGCTQVLWLDGCEHKYVEEVGASNIFFNINDEAFVVERFQNIAVGTFLHCLHSFIDCTMGSHHNHRQIRILCFDVFEQLDAVHAGHLHVGENQIQIRCFLDLKRFLSAQSGQNFIAFFF